MPKLVARGVLDGQKLIYEAQPGEQLHLLPNRSGAIITHPDRPPKLLNFDGTIEPFKALECDLPENPFNRLYLLMAE